MNHHVVHGRLNPFADCGPPIRFEVETGKTVAEIVRAAPELPAWFWHSGEVRINGKRLDRGAWHIVRPKPSTIDRPIMITMHAAFHGGGGGGAGGGGGGKNTFVTVAAIALVVGAVLVSGGLLGPVAAAGGSLIGTGLFGSAFAVGGIGATLTALGLSLGAALLMGTLAPPPAPLPKDRATEAGRDELSNGGITGNALTPMQTLPIVLGRMRFAPPLIAPPYTTLEDGIIYVHAIYGLAGHYEIDPAEIMLNGVAADEFDLAEVQIRDGDPSNEVLTINDETVVERRNQNSLLTNFVLEGEDTKGNKLVHQSNPDQDLPQWQYFKTAGVADEIRIRLFWGAIQWTDETNTVPPETGVVPVRLEIRERGTSTWLKMPVCHFKSHKLNQQLRQEIRLIWISDEPGGVRTNYEQGLHCFGAYHTTGDGQTFEYNAESYFIPAAVVDQIPVMTAATTSGVTMSASSQVSGSEAWRAADNSQVAHWLASSASVPQWIKVDFGSAKTILSYLLSPRFADSGAPVSWTLEGSNDNAAWTVVATVAGFTKWDDDDEPDPFVFQTDNPGSFRYYRVHISETLDADPANLTDLQLFLHDAPGNAVFKGGANIFAAHVNLHDDGVDIFLDPATFPVGEYECRVKRGLGIIENEFDEELYTYDTGAGGLAINANFFDYYLDGTVAKVRQTQATVASDTILESFATVSADYPFAPTIHQKGVAMIAVRAPSVTLESMSALFHSIVPVWSAEMDWSEDEPTSNPAALARHVLLATEQNAEALPGELIDEAKFIEFFQFCASEGHEFNGVMDGLSVIEAYRQVLAAGYGAPDWPGFWSMVWEHDRSAETPVQLFTPIDTRGLTISKTFPKIPQAFRPLFFDQDDDYNSNEASLVYMDGFDETNTTRIEEINLPGWTDAIKVAERALFDLRQLYLRKARYAFDIHLAGLACQRGDLVMLNHDVVSRYHDFGRIKSIAKSGGNVTGLTFENEVNLAVAVGEVVEDMAAGMQFADRSTMTLQVNEKTVTDTVTFTVPFADPGDDILHAGLSVGFGVLGSETKRMIVLWYEFVDELTRRITLVDEAPGLHA